MNKSAFASTFLPSFNQFAPCDSIRLPKSSNIPSSALHLNLSDSLHKPLRKAAVALASLSLVLRPHPAFSHVNAIDESECQCAQTKTTKHTSSKPAIFVKRQNHASSSPDPFTVTPHQDDESPAPSTGALLMVEPAQGGDSLAPAVGDTDIVAQPFLSVPKPRSHKTAKFPPRTDMAKVLPEWAGTRVHRAMHSSERMLRLPIRVRPTTVGLVGVGAFTSGSALLRSGVLKTSAGPGKVKSTVGAECAGSKGFCTVVCVHIPFCVPDRVRLLQDLSSLEKTVDLSTEDGIAKATCETAALLLEEDGLLEDSRTFAPTLDVFLADSMAVAERRFSGHVVIEESRLEKCNQSSEGSDIPIQAQTGEYGIVTLVVATTDGVNLHCFEEGTTVMKRLRATLECLSLMKCGDVAGLELVWIPDCLNSRSLSKAQLAAAFPNMEVA